MPTVTALAVRDRTNVERQRRFRQRHKQAASVTVERNAISTIEMCALGARLKSGTVTVEDLRMADRLIMHLVRMLARDSTIQLPE